MGYIGTNLVAIAAATVAGLLVGLFYWRFAGRRIRAVGTPGLAFLGVAVLAEFWLASILAGALILAPPQAGAWTMALGSALVIWIGFVLPALIVTSRFNGQPTLHGLLDCSHWLAVMLVQAAVLQGLGLTRPG